MVNNGQATELVFCITYWTDSNTIKNCWYWPVTYTDTRIGAALAKNHYYHKLTPLQTNLVPYILTICTTTPNFVLIQYTQQKARDVDTTSGSWSWGVLESVKARWNSGVITVTSALVNEHQQWNGLASWTSTQVKTISDYFKSPPTGQ